jgi:glycosyltransferase involved in cell wall biosynthesis
MRFCFITTFYPPYNFGGDGIFVQRLAAELAQRGHTVEVIHCIDSYRLLAGHDPTRAAEHQPGVTVHGLRSPLGWLSPLATQQTGRPLLKTKQIKEILDKGFDVIHYHNISLVGGPAILELGSAIKLYTMHEYWLVCPTHSLFKHNRAPCEQPECLTCSLLHKRPPQLWRSGGLLAEAVKHVDAFVAPSRFCIDIHRCMGLDLPMTHLPNFAPDLSPGKGIEAGAPAASLGAGLSAGDDPVDPKPYFLYVGRLEKVKGLHTLLPVFRRWRKARLLVAGVGSEAERLRQLAGGDANIVFLGPQSSRQLQVLYHDATAVVVPSICYEMFPLVMLEAFRQRTPVIARDLGALPEIVHEAGGGMVYNSDEELIGAMNALLADDDCRETLGQRAYQAYCDKWTAAAHLDSYFDLIRRVATGAPIVA